MFQGVIMVKWIDKNLKTILFALAILVLVVIASSAMSYCGAKKTDYNVLNYGAFGDGKTDDAKSIQAAIDDCTRNGGGKVVLAEDHTFISSEIQLKSNVELNIPTSSTLKAIEDESAYNNSAFGENRGEGMKWIWANDCDNVSISGMGTIDGSCMRFMGDELVDSYELHVNSSSTYDPRPHVFTLENVRKLHMSDVTITGAAYWTVHVVGCNDVAISSLSIKNDVLVRNSDGIDIDHSKNVRISDCFIESGDDCICLKNRREYEQYGSCENVTVTNCVMTSRSCAVKLGSENMDKINNILIDNCIIKDSNRGIGIQNRDEGTITNVTFSNITLDCHMFSDVWWGKAEPIYVTSYPRAVENNKDAGWRFPKGATEGKCGEVHNIFFNNINCISENGCFVGGDTPTKVNGVYFNNVNIQLQKSTNYNTGVYEKRPCAGEGFIYAKTCGIYVEQAANIVVNNLIVALDASFPKEMYGGEKFGC